MRICKTLVNPIVYVGYSPKISVNMKQQLRLPNLVATSVPVICERISTHRKGVFHDVRRRNNITRIHKNDLNAKGLHHSVSGQIRYQRKQ